ncbi:MAG TPA: hypothetical protein VNW92_17770 [Polyangiaceae bacterium]|jgi:hypothetical protein|nr:hypothetical protein [Polyangiaceae bacterium]
MQGNVRGVLLVSACLVTGCGAGPQVKATPQYKADSLRDARVLMIPLAVSDELGDARTGIVLSDQTRSLASDVACKSMAEETSERKIVCVDQQSIAHTPAFSELERRFALDQPIPASLWQSVREASGAKHALLFRPESVSSSNDVSRELKGSAGALVGGGALLATSAFVSVIIGASTIHEATVSTTELRYTLSASLVDMQSGQLLKVGVHSASDSRKVGRNLGFAEPPPVAPILEKIMISLGEKVLAD